MCIPKNFLCKNENQNKPNGASPLYPRWMMPALTLARRIPAISLILSTCSQLLSSQQKYRGKI